jgi:hypothetical protein
VPCDEGPDIGGLESAASPESDDGQIAGPHGAVDGGLGCLRDLFHIALAQELFDGIWWDGVGLFGVHGCQSNCHFEQTQHVENRVEIASGSGDSRRAFPTPAAPHIELCGSWPVPSVDRHAEVLNFGPSRGAGVRRQELFGVEPHLLIGFASLHLKNDPDEIGSFASEWGPLGLCEHDMPQEHIPLWTRREIRKLGLKDLDSVCRSQVELGSETLAGWRRWSAAAAALIAIAERLQKGRHSTLQEWRPVEPLLDLALDRMVPWPDKLDEPDDPDLDARDHIPIYGNDPEEGPVPSADARDFVQALGSDGRPVVDADGSPVWDPPPAEVSIRAQLDAALTRQLWLLGHAVDRWLTLGGVRVGFSWTIDDGDGVQQVRFGQTADSLFAAIGLQLAMTIGGLSALGQCYGCRLPYKPDRFGSPDRHGFCQNCRDMDVPRTIWTREKRQGRHWLGADADAQRTAARSE